LAGRESQVAGTEVALSGFPLGLNVGIYPVVHRGIISSVTPLASPVSPGTGLSAMYLRALRDGFEVYQLDATVLPGHSGSPVYATDTGRVLGIAMGRLILGAGDGEQPQRPSGISYVVPVRYLHDLLAKGK
ncbi:MAG: trypsin-like peptidase domain-containing protein, partial [Parahaliea sp.]